MPRGGARSTTRRGNGAGKGGPARPFGKDNQPTGEAKSAGKSVAAEIRERITERKGEILEAQFKRALSDTHPQGHAAAADLLNRVMPPESKVQAEVSVGAGVDAPPPETREEWLARRKREAALLGAADRAAG